MDSRFVAAAKSLLFKGSHKRLPSWGQKYTSGLTTTSHTCDSHSRRTGALQGEVTRDDCGSPTAPAAAPSLSLVFLAHLDRYKWQTGRGVGKMDDNGASSPWAPRTLSSEREGAGRALFGGPGETDGPAPAVTLAGLSKVLEETTGRRVCVCVCGWICLFFFLME